MSDNMDMPMDDNLDLDGGPEGVAQETGIAIIAPRVTGHAVALVEQFGPIYAQAKQLIADTQNVVIAGMEDITGYEQVTANANAKKNMRLAIDKDRKKIKEDAQKVVTAIDSYARPVVRALEASEDADRLRLKLIDDEREIERQKQERILDERYAKRCKVLIDQMGMSYDPIERKFTLEDATINDDIVRLSGADVLKKLITERVMPIAERIKTERAAADAALAKQREEEEAAQKERERIAQETADKLKEVNDLADKLRENRTKQLKAVGGRTNIDGTVFLIGDRSIPIASLHGWSEEEFTKLQEQARVRPGTGMSLAMASQIRGGEQQDELHINDVLDQPDTPDTEGSPTILASLEVQDLSVTREAIDLCFRLSKVMERMKTKRGIHAAVTIADKIKYLNQFFSGLANEFK